MIAVDYSVFPLMDELLKFITRESAKCAGLCVLIGGEPPSLQYIISDLHYFKLLKITQTHNFFFSEFLSFYFKYRIM